VAVSIRIARASDAHQITELTGQLGYEVDGPVIAERLSRFISRGDQEFLVAEDEGRIVGWVQAVVEESIQAGPFVVIGGLVVAGTHRRRGIGRLLMAQAEAWATEQGQSVVRLWSSSTRTAAHRFYEALGYTNIKTQYAVVKAIDPEHQDALLRLVPDVDG
jgi:ribosomal protein S18 acetylase RimI-like enzyme